MTFVEKGVNFDGGEVFLWVSTANFGQDVCVCVYIINCTIGFGVISRPQSSCKGFFIPAL